MKKLIKKFIEICNIENKATNFCGRIILLTSIACVIGVVVLYFLGGYI